MMLPSKVPRWRPNVIREEACVCCQGPPLNQPHGWHVGSIVDNSTRSYSKRRRALAKLWDASASSSISLRSGPVVAVSRSFRALPSSNARVEAIAERLARAATDALMESRRSGGTSSEIHRDTSPGALPSPVASCSPAMAVTPPLLDRSVRRSPTFASFQRHVNGTWRQNTPSNIPERLGVPLLVLGDARPHELGRRPQRHQSAGASRANASQRSA